MKKLINILLLTALAAGFVSCDFDQESPDSIPYEEGFESMQNILALERGAHSRLRTAYSPSSMLVSDIQTDYMHPVYGFSNTYGPVYFWSFSHDDGDVRSTWDYFYAVIGHCNFILDGLKDNKLVEFVPTPSEQLTLTQIQGRMLLMRALCYSVLAERFCGDYDVTTAETAWGLPLLKSHNPDAKEGRSTLAKTYEMILEDLTQARTDLQGVTGAPNSTTLNLDCVTALEARVYLQMDNHSQALLKANLLINNSSYSLVGSEKELQDMWTYDKSSEIIFKFYASKTELAFTWGIDFAQDYFNGGDKYKYMYPDYVPTQTCLDSFDAADWRRKAYFLECNFPPTSDSNPLALIKGWGYFAEKMFVFTKYPGNPDLRTSEKWNYYNSFKVFRLAEMYLIAAEAAAQIPDGNAATPLNALRRQRGLSPISGDVTLADVQTERYREMMMEGTRLTDLKRWGLGMERGAAQSGFLLDDKEIGHIGSYITLLLSDLRVTPTNYKFLWPIPASETFANPQIASQQNPGWER